MESYTLNPKLHFGASEAWASNIFSTKTTIVKLRAYLGDMGRLYRSISRAQESNLEGESLHAVM